MSTFGFRLYLLFTASWFLHFTARVPPLAMVRFDMMMVAALMVLTAVSWASRPNAARTTTTTALLVIIIYSIVTVPFVEWPGSVLQNGLMTFIKGCMFYFFTLAFVTTRSRLRTFMFVFLACQTLRVAEPLYLHVAHGYWGAEAFMSGEMLERLSGAPSDIVNPNGLAFVIVTIVPLYHYLCTSSVKGWFVYAAVAPGLLYALLLTGSRSGLVGLIAVYGIIAWRSRHRLFFAVAATGAAMTLFSVATPDQKDRYLSIVSSNTKNAATAEGRMSGLEDNLRVAMRRPLFGHGLGTSLEANFHFTGNAQPAHNLYIEVAQELGFIGLGLYLWFLGALIANFRGLAVLRQRVVDADPFLFRLLDGMKAWVFFNLVFSFASFGLSGYEWYLFGGLCVVVSNLLAEGAQPGEGSTGGSPDRGLATRRGRAIRTKPARTLLQPSVPR